jgi:hypothetical protein
MDSEPSRTPHSTGRQPEFGTPNSANTAASGRQQNRRRSANFSDLLQQTSNTPQRDPSETLLYSHPADIPKSFKPPEDVEGAQILLDRIIRYFSQVKERKQNIANLETVFDNEHLTKWKTFIGMMPDETLTWDKLVKTLEDMVEITTRVMTLEQCMIRNLPATIGGDKQMGSGAIALKSLVANVKYQLDRCVPDYDKLPRVEQTKSIELFINRIDARIRTIIHNSWYGIELDNLRNSSNPLSLFLAWITKDVLCIKLFNSIEKE